MLRPVAKLRRMREVRGRADKTAGSEGESQFPVFRRGVVSWPGKAFLQSDLCLDIAGVSHLRKTDAISIDLSIIVICLRSQQECWSAIKYCTYMDQISWHITAYLQFMPNLLPGDVPLPAAWTVE